MERLVLLGEDQCKADGWHTRFKLNVKPHPAHGQSIIIAVPLKERYGKAIDEVEFCDPARFFRTLSKTLTQHYSKGTGFDDVMAMVLRDTGGTFGQYCARLTLQIRDYLELPLLICDSRALRVKRHCLASRWLAEIGQSIGGTEYVCAADAGDKYLNVREFVELGIKVSPQHYRMPPYWGSTDATASILDLLMRTSKEQARSVLCGSVY